MIPCISDTGATGFENESVVHKINLPFFYRLATQLTTAREVPTRQGATRFQVYAAFWDARQILNALFGAFPHLVLSRPTANDLYDRLGRWIDGYQKELAKDDYADSAAVEDYEAIQIATAAKDLEVVLLADLQGMPTFIVTQKGIYSIQSLLDDGQRVFPPTILAKLNAEVVAEVRQSGRCLAFEVATASGFHMMRAVESVMHSYYVALCKPAQRKKLDNWGAYIMAFRKSANPEAVKVAEMLQQIKDQDRNLIMHPEAVLTTDDAFTLFEIGKSVIMAMAPRLPMPRAKAAKKK